VAGDEIKLNAVAHGLRFSAFHPPRSVIPNPHSTSDPGSGTGTAENVAKLPFESRTLMSIVNGGSLAAAKSSCRLPFGKVGSPGMTGLPGTPAEKGGTGASSTVKKALKNTSKKLFPKSALVCKRSESKSDGTTDGVSKVTGSPPGPIMPKS